MTDAVRVEFGKRPAKVLRRELEALGGVVTERGKKSRRDLASAMVFTFPDGWNVLVRKDVTARFAEQILNSARTHLGLPPLAVKTPRVKTDRPRPPKPPRIDPTRIQITPHAQARFNLMRRQAGVSKAEVVDTLLNPLRRRFNDRHGSFAFVGDRVTVDVCVDNGHQVIKTLEWSTPDLWEKYPRPERAGK